MDEKKRHQRYHERDSVHQQGQSDACGAWIGATTAEQGNRDAGECRTDQDRELGRALGDAIGLLELVALNKLGHDGCLRGIEERVGDAEHQCEHIEHP